MYIPDTFFDGYRAAFGKLNQSQVDGLDFLLARFDTHPKWLYIPHVAYAFATIKIETNHTFEPIEELGGITYLLKYWTRWRLRTQLGNVKVSDAWVYKGRGYVQLTGRKNYREMGVLLNLPLLDFPHLATIPRNAFEIMTAGMFRGSFTGKKLTDYIHPGTPSGYENARKVINDSDRAKEIASIAVTFERILRKSFS
jgi:putative chitinase